MPIREDEAEATLPCPTGRFHLRAGEAPFLQRIDDDRRHRDLALAGRRFRPTHDPPIVRPLVHMDDLFVEIDIVPAEPAQFG